MGDRRRRRRRRSGTALAVSIVALSIGFAAVAGWAFRVATLEPLDDDRRRQQLAFLDRAIERGAAERAQQLFPEGFVFQHVLTGLAHATAAEPATRTP